MEACLNKINLAIRHGRKEEAVAAARKMRKLYPDSVEALHALARMLCLNNDLESACALYQELLDKGSQGDAGCLNNLAVFLYELGRTEDAIQTFRLALKKYPAEWRICANFALVLSDLEILATAESILTRITEEHPHDQALKFVTDMILDKVPYPAANLFPSVTDTVQVLSFLRLFWEDEGNVCNSELLDINDRRLRLAPLYTGQRTPLFYPGRHVVLVWKRREQFVGIQTKVLAQTIGASPTFDLLRPASLKIPQRRSQYRMQLHNIIQSISVDSCDPISSHDWAEKDVSASGMSFWLKRQLAKDSQLNIRLRINELTFDFDAVVVRCQPAIQTGSDVQIKFVNVQPDTFKQLAKAILNLRLETDKKVLK